MPKEYKRKDGTPRKLQPRVCLKCDKKFPSWGPANRICGPCNLENEKIYETSRGPVQKPDDG